MNQVIFPAIGYHIRGKGNECTLKEEGLILQSCMKCNHIRGWGEMYIQHKEKQFFVFQSSWKRKSTLNIYCVDLI